MKKYSGQNTIRIVALVVCCGLNAFAAKPQDGGASPNIPLGKTQVLGRTTTLLPDGRWLLLGGQSADNNLLATATMKNLTGDTEIPLSVSLKNGRAWHTATVLPDGTVLVVGGLGRDGRVVQESELFDPESESFSSVSQGPMPRVFHTATLLTDGRVLIAGGVSSTGMVLNSLELWDPRHGTSMVLPVQLSSARRNHAAILLPDGRVLFTDGKDSQGQTIALGEVFDPESRTISTVVDPASLLQPDKAMTEVRATSPEDRAEGIAIDSLISIRFSRPILPQSVKLNTVVLKGPEGIVESKVIAAENGMLAFITPGAALVPGTTYEVTASGITDRTLSSVAFAQFTFMTAGDQPDDESWTPSLGWRTGRAPSQWQSLPAIQAAPGITALAGQVLKLNGNPLPHVTLEMDGHTTLTDKTGRFLLANISPGHHAMTIDATTVNHGSTHYGLYEVGVDIKPGRTNILGYTIWMTALDMVHAVTIPSPTTSETVIRTPLLPGLELHLPAGTVITDHDGKAVTEITVTPIPLDRPPFPLPAGVQVPIYFTIQPGSAYIKVIGTNGSRGARLIYPNSFNAPAGILFNFWNYNPDQKGWYVYGNGRVTADRTQVVPNPGVEIYEFTGAMVANPGNGGGPGGAPGNNGADGADPIDLSTGLFIYSKTDLVLQDVISLVLTRTYRPNDPLVHAFGIGTSMPYDMFDVGSTDPTSVFASQDVVQPDGSRIHFQRVSSGIEETNAVYTHTSSPTRYFASTLGWNGAGWTLSMKDGSQYQFPDPPTVNGVGTRDTALIGMKDRHGNALTFTRDLNRNLVQISSPNGRWIQFVYDQSNRVTLASDNIGRTVQYFYDAGGRLSQVVDANGGVTNYTYDANNQMLTIQDARGIVYLTNQYDANGRVVRQTQADNTVYSFAYITDPITGKVTQTDMTDPRGIVKRTTFDSNGYTATEIFALGKPEQETITYTRDPNTNLISSVVDPLNRETDYTYDSMGNLASAATMAHSAAAAVTSFTYEPNFNQIASITDPLNHTTTFGYDASGNVITVSDHLQHVTTLSYDAQGRPLTSVDPLLNATQFSYTGGDLIGITDALQHSTTFSRDGAGRLIGITNPLDQTTKYEYSPLSQLVQIVDPLNGTTTFNYDGNGNLLSLTDAKGNSSNYSYDNMDRLQSRIDSLLREETYNYDSDGNVVQFTDRRGKITSYQYDFLNRGTFAGFGTVIGPPTTYESTLSVTYDAGNRVVDATDSVTGLVHHTYDDVNRTFSETSPFGTITTVSDAAGRRSSMSITGQPNLTYSYDDANRLKSVLQAGSTVSFTYDDANRRSSLNLPNGIVVSYRYDLASRITSMTYQNGNTTLGNLTYAYDSADRRTQVGGTFARTELPQAVPLAAYDSANELVQWGTMSLAYDANGNLLSDGTNGYAWNAKNQLSQFNSTTFQYDSLGRRIRNALGSNLLYDNLDAVQELSGTTPIANRLAGGTDEFFSRSATGFAGIYPLADASGSTIALTDSVGNLATQYTYDPFGDTSISGTPNNNPFQYTGRENDLNGLYYFRARYYSPSMQRFLSEDPIKFFGGSNYYTYALDSPPNFTDPSGDAAGIDDLVLAVGGAVVGVAVQAGSDFLNGEASDWQHYAGAAAGGAVGGLAIEYTAAMGTGALSALTTSAVTQGLEMASGKQCPSFDWFGAIRDTALGAVLGKVLPELKWPKVNAGTSNWVSIANGIETKGQQIGVRTVIKKSIGENVSGYYASAAGVAVTAITSQEDESPGRSCGCK